MSDTEGRKSMDDVLASIRRIVRSEKEPEEAVALDEQTPPPADGPLELTPDMRMDEQIVETAVEPVAEAIPAMPDDSQIRDMIRDVLREELAGDQLGETVKSILREELVNGEIGSNISQNVMALIRSEVSAALKG